jgi:XTP/dITP diphosphohydrolase
MIRLLFATRNAHKTRELSEILGDDFAIEDLRLHPEIGEIAEGGATFLENAQLKALTVSRQLPGLVLADDSGLEVDSLGGGPGIFSARYAGENAGDAANRAKLLAQLARLPNDAPTTARFRCVLVLARGGRLLGSYNGAVEGSIVRRECGQGGFGYDSLFLPNEREETFAEMSAEEKNSLSHRAIAAHKLRVSLTRMVE